MPSLVGEIGDVIERHMRMIGLIKDDELDEHQKALIASKRAEFEGVLKQAEDNEPDSFPEGSQLCGKCHTKAMIQMDGCMTCLNCGDSKCG